MAKVHLSYNQFKSIFGDLGVTEWAKFNWIKDYYPLTNTGFVINPLERSYGNIRGKVDEKFISIKGTASPSSVDFELFTNGFNPFVYKPNTTYKIELIGDGIYDGVVLIGGGRQSGITYYELRAGSSQIITSTTGGTDGYSIIRVSKEKTIDCNLIARITEI